MNSSKKIMNQQNESKEVKKESSAAVPCRKGFKTDHLNRIMCGSCFGIMYRCWYSAV